MKSNDNSLIFLTWLYSQGTIFMYLHYSHPLIYHLLPNVWKVSYTISASIFVDVPYWQPYSTEKSIYCVVPGPLQGFFHFGEEIVIAWTQKKTATLDGTELHHSPVTPLLLLSRTSCAAGNGRIQHPPYSPDMSPCHYDLFIKVKEPLRGTRYNTRDELIHAIRRSIRNINKDGRTDGVRHLPNIWQKVINKGTAILKIHGCCTPVNTAKSEISNCMYI